MIDQEFQSISSENYPLELQTDESISKMSYEFSQFDKLFNYDTLFQHDEFIQEPPTSTNNNIPSDNSFENLQEAINNQSLLISPQQLGFYPIQYWSSNTPYKMTFGTVVKKFFQCRRNKNTIFIFKLYNLLLLSDKRPEFADIIGIKWVSNEIFKVNIQKFANVLGLKPVSTLGALFHLQGNFPTHGFINVEYNELVKKGILVQNNKYDYKEERYLKHSTGEFVRDLNPETLYTICRYRNEKKKMYIKKENKQVINSDSPSSLPNNNIISNKEPNWKTISFYEQMF